MTTYLLDGKEREGSPYGCWNAERPINGAPVNHDHTGPVIAETVWLFSEPGQPIKCGKAQNGESLTDLHCTGCQHREKQV